MLIAQPRLPFQHLLHPDVRNLAWCLTSPALWQTGPLEKLRIQNPSQIRRTLQQLEQQPEPLIEALSRVRSHRLGSYYESLWHFILRTFLHPDRLHYGLPVRDQQGRTLGEYDFLLRMAGQPLWLHLEVCIKFYLGIPRPDRPACWVGLSPRDRMDQKIERLTQHQLKLGNFTCAHHQQQRLGMQLGQRLGWMQGRLFYPWEQQLNPPSSCNKHHLRGWWASQGQLESWLKQHKQARFQPLLKQQWLTPLSVGQIKATETAPLPSIKNGQPMMVARLIHTPLGWREQDRGVIVSDDWLHCESMLEALDQA